MAERYKKMKNILTIPTYRVKACFVIGIFLLSFKGHTQAINLELEQAKVLPKLSIKNISYVGGFRLPLTESGDSRIAYSEGSFTLAPARKSFFVVGHAHHQAIAEFSVPKIVETNDIEKMAMSKILQPFSKILHRSKTGNKDNQNRISGLEYFQNQIWVNTIEFYDADANARQTSLVIRNADDLKKTDIDGFFNLKGGAHAAGWLSKIPTDWQKKLAAEYITGYASNPSINSRLSIGPTAFTFYPFSILDSDLESGVIPTEALLDFSLKHPLNSDRYNDSKTNSLWTEVSAAVYGFIVPGTETYFVIGHSGGHKSGIGYKIKQDNGSECGGPCSKEFRDNYNYYWMWSVRDLEQVHLGNSLPHSSKPYEFGYFDKKHKGWLAIGADYDAEKNLLFVLYASRDYKQSKYETAPLMLVYKINI